MWSLAGNHPVLVVVPQSVLRPTRTIEQASQIEMSVSVQRIQCYAVLIRPLRADAVTYILEGESLIKEQGRALWEPQPCLSQDAQCFTTIAAVTKEGAQKRTVGTL
ncbi:hypothetical protein DFLDMN_004794 [Cupriavidus sp. H19C3]